MTVLCTAPVDAFKKDPGAFIQGAAVVLMAASVVMGASPLLATTAGLTYLTNRRGIHDTVKRIMGHEKP